jgi:Rrf2 family protein
MFVTRKADYAIRCVLYLTKNQGWLATIDEISKNMHIPKTFLAKILQQLLKSGIATSTRGVKGGFQLSRNPEDINLLEIIEIIQGKSAVNICAIDGKKCSLSKKCSVHPVWVKIREQIEKELREQSFKKLADQREILIVGAVN